MANIMAESRADWVLRLAGSPDFLDVDPQAALPLRESRAALAALTPRIRKALARGPVQITIHPAEGAA